MSPQLLGVITTIQLSLFSKKGPSGEDFEALLALEKHGQNVQKYLETIGKGAILREYRRYADHVKELMERYERLENLQIDMRAASLTNPLFRLFELRAKFLMSTVITETETIEFMQGFTSALSLVLQEENLTGDYKQNNKDLAEVDKYIFKVYLMVENQPLVSPSQRMVKRAFSFVE